jgi:vancomycin resistance protein YoaR
MYAPLGTDASLKIRPVRAKVRQLTNLSSSPHSERRNSLARRVDFPALSAGAESSAVRIRRKRAVLARPAVQRSLLGFALLAVIGFAIGLLFAGSPDRLAGGVTVAGVKLGGMTADEARRELERKAAALEDVPVVFTAAGRTWRIRPSELGVRVDWAAAVTEARRQGDGVGPLRGLRRIGVRVFGADVVPHARYFGPALVYDVNAIARELDQPHREAAVKLRGLKPVVVPARPGHVLDRAAARKLVVRAVTGFSREPVALPIRSDRPRVTAAQLGPVAVRARRALSAPVRLQLGPTRWRIPRWRLAGLLALPHAGTRALAIGGPGAQDYFDRLKRRVDTPSRDADFAVNGDRVRVVPARPGRVVDVARTSKALLAAALAPVDRVAHLVVAHRPAKRSTADAHAMGITGLVGGYATFYGGDANRIHNVQLVAQLLDRHLIAPGATFSFNQATGERTAEKGFREAPVIINGELQTGLGGGVCQVSTTTFNAAYEAGVDITSRTNHALYISHYPLGRDATVNYPDTDLRFVNDTEHWLLLRTFVGSSSLTVSLYGTPQHRRVESDVAPLVVTGGAPVKKVRDPRLLKGKTVVEEGGVPSQATHVRRRVYDDNGKLLHDNTWYSSYRGEARVIRIGTKPKAKPKPKKKPVAKAGAEQRKPDEPAPVTEPALIDPTPLP